ncbi:hypothetical protein [Hoylesella marshii]|uniref:hypothetical protein n=1 Tax=Hoylesella marshii TaxID=189722 RepID=UPI0028D41463|nr:hypothetical protein [Hoylesella marshii]
MPQTTIIILLLLTAILVVQGILLLRPNIRMWKRGKATSLQQKKQLIDDTLHRLQCPVVWKSEDDAQIAEFTFQEGHFRLYVSEDAEAVRLSYLFFLCVSIDKLNLVRELCNRCNMNTRAEHLLYTVDNTEHGTNVHIIAGIYLHEKTAERVMTEALRNIFAWRNSFVQKYHELNAERGKFVDLDVEQGKAELDRQFLLLREQEILRRPLWKGNREMLESGMALPELAERLFGITDFQPQELKVVTDTVKVFTDKGIINTFRIYSALTDGINLSAFVRAHATLEVCFCEAKKSDRPRFMQLFLETAGNSTHTLYYRATATLMPLSPAANLPLGSCETQERSCGCLMAVDLDATTERKNLEFRFMWQDAKDKQQRGEEHLLSDEQRLILHIIDPTIAYCLYFGKQLFLRQRYYEALAYLEYAFESMQETSAEMSNEQMETLCEVAYLSGFCHAELHRLKEAYYYLFIAFGFNHITYTEAYVNCLVNMGDFRAERLIDTLLTQTQGNRHNGETENEGYVQKFISFLQRRKTTLLIRRKKYNEAEELLKRMLNEPDNSDFALHELATIQRLRKN